MKHFPLKTTLICLIVVPVIYSLVLQNVQSALSQRYLNKIQNIMISDATPLLEGREVIETRIASNVSRFLQTDVLSQWAKLELSIFIMGADGEVLYPVFEKQKRDQMKPDEIARRNFVILSQGIQPKVEVYLPHGSRLANLILVFFLALSVVVFLLVYRRASHNALKESQANTNIIQNLQEEDRVVRERLKELQGEKKSLTDQVKDLRGRYKKDQDRARINETEMFDEIVNLEEELESVREKELANEAEIEELKSRIEKYEKRKSPKAKRNAYDLVSKRFASLYKQIKFNRRAVSGFINLTEDMQIKAEELILQLDREPDKVIIKRKVFSGKKHRGNVLEVIFGYNGRLYFRNPEGNLVEVLVIGTKNSQGRDMDYLHKL